MRLNIQTIALQLKGLWFGLACLTYILFLKSSRLCLPTFKRLPQPGHHSHINHKPIRPSRPPGSSYTHTHQMPMHFCFLDSRIGHLWIVILNASRTLPSLAAVRQVLSRCIPTFCLVFCIFNLHTNLLITSSSSFSSSWPFMNIVCLYSFTAAHSRSHILQSMCACLGLVWPWLGSRNNGLFQVMLPLSENTIDCWFGMFSKGSASRDLRFFLIYMAAHRARKRKHTKISILLFFICAALLTQKIIRLMTVFMQISSQIDKNILMRHWLRTGSVRSFAPKNFGPEIWLNLASTTKRDKFVRSNWETNSSQCHTRFREVRKSTWMIFKCKTTGKDKSRVVCIEKRTRLSRKCNEDERDKLVRHSFFAVAVLLLVVVMMSQKDKPDSPHNNKQTVRQTLKTSQKANTIGKKLAKDKSEQWRQAINKYRNSNNGKGW